MTGGFVNENQRKTEHVPGLVCSAVAAYFRDFLFVADYNVALLQLNGLEF